MTSGVRLGVRANAGQFGLLVALNALVGAMVGLERSVLPLVGEEDFALGSTTAILAFVVAFVVAFGAAKALTNLAAGAFAGRVGRKRLLVAGWLVALPVPLLIGFASRDFGFVLGALVAGAAADLASPEAAIAIVAALTAASGLAVAATRWQARPGAAAPAGEMALAAVEREPAA